MRLTRIAKVNERRKALSVAWCGVASSRRESPQKALLLALEALDVRTEGAMREAGEARGVQQLQAQELGRHPHALRRSQAHRGQ